MSAVCSPLAPETVESKIDVTPVTLISLYHEHYQHMNEYQLKEETERVFYSTKISDMKTIVIERAIVVQHSSLQWRNQCSGYITASPFHDVYVRKESSSS